MIEGGRPMFFVTSNINIQLGIPYYIWSFHKTTHLLKDIFSLGFRMFHMLDLKKLHLVLVNHSDSFSM
jgi:hypothetical protein